jgi:hypothetical protein
MSYANFLFMPGKAIAVPGKENMPAIPFGDRTSQAGVCLNRLASAFRT